MKKVFYFIAACLAASALLWANLVISAPVWMPVLRAEEESTQGPPPVVDENIHAGEKDLGGLSLTPTIDASFCCVTQVVGGTFPFEEEEGMCWYIVGPACAHPDLSSCEEICGFCQAGPHYSTIAPCCPEGKDPTDCLQEYHEQWLEEQGLAP